MDIHKPKAAHSIREFLIEIGTIVCGILIALGLEQAVEAIHWSHKVEDAEARLKQELVALDSYAFERDQVGACLDKRLADMTTKLLGGSGRWTPLPPMESLNIGHVAYFAPHRQWQDTVWKGVGTDGTAGHLPAVLQQRYGFLYAKTAQIVAWDNDEFVDVGALNVLNYQTEIPAAQRIEFAARIEQERRRNKIVTLLSRQTMVLTERFGAHDKAGEMDFLLGASNVYRACYKLGMLPPGSPEPRTPSDPVTMGLIR